MAADCAQVIRDALELTDAEAKQVIRDLERRMAASRDAKMDPGQLDALIREQADSYRKAGQMEKVRAQLTAIKIAEAGPFLRAFKNPADALMTLLAGHKRFRTQRARIRGALNSVSAHQMEMRAWFLRSLDKEISKGNPRIWKQLRDPEFQGRIAREMWALPEGKSVTGDAEAYRVADVIEKHKEMLRKLANQEGANIAKLPNHVISQSHDAMKMLAGGMGDVARVGRRLRGEGKLTPDDAYKAWRDFILPRLDAQRTFEGNDPDEVLRAIWDKIIRNEQGFYAPARERGGSLAKRLSQHRFLHFAGPDQWMEYQGRYGQGDFLEGMMRSFENNVRAVALMQRLGPNPNTTFNRLMEQETLAGINLDEPIPGGYGMAIRNTFDQITGAANDPVSPSAARWMQNLRGWQVMARLGRVLLAQAGDVPIFAAMSRYNGVGWLEGYGRTVSSLMNQVPEPIRKEMGAYLGTFSDGILGSMYGRISANDMRPGTMARWTNFFFKAAGAQQWTDRLKIGFMHMQSRLLARTQGAQWGELDSFLRNQLERYGFDEADWSALAKEAGTEIGGTRYLTPDTIGDEALAHKVRTWMVNEADFGVLQPGARERALALQGLRPGTAAGEAARFFSQFKMFSLSVATRVLPRAMEMGVPGAVNTAVMGAVFGYIGMTGKDLASGMEPRIPGVNVEGADIAKLTGEAFMHGGGLGMIGDMLFADFSDYGASFPEWAGGPVVSAFQDLLEVYSRTLRGEDAGARATFAALKQVPFANLFYLQSALNYLMIFHIQESMNPGYLRRMERRMKREANQEFIVPPSRWVR